ncbi:MAG: metallophosphoesterase [Oscillospiraceae bacterium]|nr:metallophosphoesterase [Oscillospiraceae bacterium]
MYFKKHKAKAVLLCILSAIIIFFAVNIIVSNCILTYNEYTVETTKIKGQTNFVAISDSEGRSFGENNSRLAEKVKDANPKFVMILGDMVDNDTGDYSAVVDLCNTLTKDFPVYYALGNHELSFSESEQGMYLKNLKNAIDNTGATMLINEMTDFTTKDGDKITIAGLKRYPFFDYDAPNYDNEENRLFQKYLKQEDESHFSILMCHYPETYVWGFDKYNIDLMVCGHTHGGLFRIPFVGGVYAPEQGFMPKYSKGYYTNGNANMLISAGLNNSQNIPRLFNPLDVTVITLKGK